jgi:hypothetical protein
MFTPPVPVPRQGEPEPNLNWALPAPGVMADANTGFAVIEWASGEPEAACHADRELKSEPRPHAPELECKK